MWENAVLAVQILLLVAGWLLFQQARSELTARAAQMPVLEEVQSLKESVAALIEQLKLEATQRSAQLEARCLEARELALTLERRLEDAREVAARPTAAAPVPSPASPRREAVRPRVEPTPAPIPEGAARYQDIHDLADAGVDALTISHRTGLTIGEVELILNLRGQAERLGPQ